MDEERVNSAAYKYLKLTWDGVTDKSGFSWRNLNACMNESLSLAIRSQLQFEEGDFYRIASEFRWGFWNGGGGEGFYNLSVDNGNMSATKALEYFWHRQPFITDVLYGNRLRRRRLVVGNQFFWIGQRVTVTSFNDEAGKVIAVIYRKPEAPEKREVLDRITEREHGVPSPIEKIYRISNEELKGKAMKIIGVAHGKK